MKLYAVYVRGGLKGFNPAYALGENSAAAYTRVRNWLDENDFGFRAEREMLKIELIAEEIEGCDCGARLFLIDFASRQI